MRRKRYTLGAKLALVAAPFLLLGFAAVVLTLWVSSQLDGGAAAMSEAGRMRMQANRWALAVSSNDHERLSALAAEFDHTLELLREGDAGRPLTMPWDEIVRARFATVERAWQELRRHGTPDSGTAAPQLAEETAAITGHIDALVDAIEEHMARWTALMHLLQVALLVVTLLGAVALLVVGYVFVLEPVGRLKRATERIVAGDLGVLVESGTTDEFGALAECFNGMAQHLQSMYADLEERVAQKTAQLEEKHERLEALYDVTALAATATTLGELASGFARRVIRVAHADGVAIRWVDESSDAFLLLASEGLSEEFIRDEHCVRSGQCFCAAHTGSASARVIAVGDTRVPGARRCAIAGYASIVSLPVRLHERLMGEVDLFFRASFEPTAAERSLLEALAAHLASAMENLRLTSLEKESAVAQERAFIARELHDSIAQTLAFLKIQVHLMREAVIGGDTERAGKVIGEIDAGVRECYGDVRELLVHFRTRASDVDIEPALRSTLRKFEHQSGLQAQLTMRGHGAPLAPDVQIQVLHIVQEALSNVRKHAQAERVQVTVERGKHWRFVVTDDGVGFAPSAETDETHVGLCIMAERAERIGATLQVDSAPGRGTSVTLAFAPGGSRVGAVDAAEGVVGG